MSSPLEVAHSATFPAPIDVAYDAVLAAPLEQVLRRRFWALPPVVGVRDQVGGWGTLGRTRTIVMADKGTMREEVTVAQRPHTYGYDISEITGPVRPLVSAAQGHWSFTPDGDGTRHLSPRAAEHDG